MNENNITNKEWLDIAWKYFQQHAQQRISYFNFFVVFSTILTTGLVATFQKGFGLPYLGIAIGVIQAFLSVMFWKIDQRNKFLTKHAEEFVKSFESKTENASSMLFTSEEAKTNQQATSDKGKFFFRKQITHSKSYKIIYVFFFVWGVAGSIISSTMSKLETEMELAKIEASIHLKFNKIDSIENAIHRRDSITNLLFENLKQLALEIDSLQLISKSYKDQTSK